MHDDPSWTLYADGFRANEETQVDNRLISEEPMYLVRPSISFSLKVASADHVP